MDDLNDSRIKRACDLIMNYSYMSAAISFRQTDNLSLRKTYSKIMTNCRKGFDLDLLVNENNWEELFKNEEWLNLLKEAQGFIALEESLRVPLLFLSKIFQKETEQYLSFDFKT